MNIQPQCPQWIDPENMTPDATPLKSITVLSPLTGKWGEVTVMGNINVLNSLNLEKAFTNELHDGSIIDIGGVLLLFQKPQLAEMNSTLSNHGNTKCSDYESPNHIVRNINKQGPQCPVMLQTIEFPDVLSRKERSLHIWENIKSGNINLTATSLVNSSNSSTSQSHISNSLVSLSSHSGTSDESSRPYVYPACGHVFGYSRELSERYFVLEYYYYNCLKTNVICICKIAFNLGRVHCVDVRGILFLWSFHLRMLFVWRNQHMFSIRVDMLRAKR
jgi:hypothetical protein